MTDDINYNGKMMKKGKEGEFTVFKYLKTLDNILYIIDLSEDETFRKPDIDGIIIDSKFIPHTIEIKSDKRIDETSNIWWETHRMYNISGYYEGWATRSKSEYLFIYCSKTNNLYIFKFEILRNRINELKKNIKFISKSVQTNSECITFGELIPLKMVEDIIYKKENLNSLKTDNIAQEEKL
jgi:hypothetical protein